MNDKEIKDAVKALYAEIAESSQQGCCSCSGCCGDTGTAALDEIAGYKEEDLANVPQEASLGLGCGNPVAMAELGEGETVLDLGSGAGMDVFLAANRVGPEGMVIGVDMTRAMIDKANSIARKEGYKNVEFRLGEIEALPVDDCSVDTVVSNCVINLSADKPGVFREAFRVLKTGGRLIVSDIVADKPIPRKLREDLDAWAGCIAGALEQGEYLGGIEDAGFNDLQVQSNGEFYFEDEDSKEAIRLLSITVKAYKRG